MQSHGASGRATYRLLDRGRTLRLATAGHLRYGLDRRPVAILLVTGMVPFAVQGTGAGIAVLFWFD